jgi:carbonic anhydrase/acetyltransferase-like protein (isoleucine patch superfamily)
MTLFRLGGKAPVVEEGSYVSPAAHVIGPVRIGTGCWIGPGAVIRADFGPITIGSWTAVEENCVIHCKPGTECMVGSHVTIGHGAVIHGALIEDWATVGMGAVVGVDARLGRWSLVGEGAVVKSRQDVSPETIVAGTPAKAIGTMDPERRAFWEEGKRFYEELVARYLEGLEPL